MKKYLFAILLAAPLAGFSQSAKNTNPVSTGSQGTVIGVALSGPSKNFQPLTARGEATFTDLSAGKYTLQLSNVHEFKSLKCILTITGKDGKATSKMLEGTGDEFGVGVEFDMPANATLTVGVSQ